MVREERIWSGRKEGLALRETEAQDGQMCCSQTVEGVTNWGELAVIWFSVGSHHLALTRRVT